MRRMRAATLALLVLAVCPVGTATAQTPSVALWGGFQTYGMSDVNDEIRAINTVIAPLQMETVRSGFGFGVAIGFDFETASLCAAFERLPAGSEVGDATGRLEYDLPANGILGRVSWHPMVRAVFQPSLFAGIGLVIARGDLRLDVTGSPTISADVHGSGPLLEIGAAADWWVGGERVAIVPAIGYRRARIENTEVNGEPVYKADGLRYALDYSGFLVRVGVKFAIR